MPARQIWLRRLERAGESGWSSGSRRGVASRNRRTTSIAKPDPDTAGRSSSSWKIACRRLPRAGHVVDAAGNLDAGRPRHRVEAYGDESLSPTHRADESSLNWRGSRGHVRRLRWARASLATSSRFSTVSLDSARDTHGLLGVFQRLRRPGHGCRFGDGEHARLRSWARDRPQRAVGRRHRPAHRRGPRGRRRGQEDARPHARDDLSDPPAQRRRHRRLRRHRADAPPLHPESPPAPLRAPAESSSASRRASPESRSAPSRKPRSRPAPAKLT